MDFRNLSNISETHGCKPRYQRGLLALEIEGFLSVARSAGRQEDGNIAIDGVTFEIAFERRAVNLDAFDRADRAPFSSE